MAELSQLEYQQYEGELIQILDEVKTLLPKDAIDHVEFYIQHGELEMAYESLCLSLIELKRVFPSETRLALRSLGLSLELDKESVYMPEFWLYAEENLFASK